jgi:hypothetical protein
MAEDTHALLDVLDIRADFDNLAGDIGSENVWVCLDVVTAVLNLPVYRIDSGVGSLDENLEGGLTGCFVVDENGDTYLVAFWSRVWSRVDL